MNKFSLRNLFKAFFKGRSLKCPACGEVGVFEKVLTANLKKSCNSCGLDYEKFDIGDGAIYSAMFLVIFLVPILAIIANEFFEISAFFNIIIWTFFTIVFSIALLVFFKSAFIHAEYYLKQSKNLKSW